MLTDSDYHKIISKSGRSLHKTVSIAYEIIVKIRYMVILNDEMIYNKIEQGLINIPGDFVIQKHVRL